MKTDMDRNRRIPKEFYESFVKAQSESENDQKLDNILYVYGNLLIFISLYDIVYCQYIR